MKNYVFGEFIIEHTQPNTWGLQLELKLSAEDEDEFGIEDEAEDASSGRQAWR